VIASSSVFYGNRFSVAFPIFEHPTSACSCGGSEVLGPIDPAAQRSDDRAMTLCGDMSKGERMRVMTCVHADMHAQTAIQGCFLLSRRLSRSP
jgi:hypothetical protein